MGSTLCTAPPVSHLTHEAPGTQGPRDPNTKRRASKAPASPKRRAYRPPRTTHPVPAQAAAFLPLFMGCGASSHSQAVRKDGAQERDARTLETSPAAIESTKATSDTTGSIKHADEETQRAFLDRDWLPFIDQLNQLREQTRRRLVLQCLPHEVLPSHALLSELTQRNLELTRRWHGRSNACAVYDLLMDLGECDGHNTYRFADIPQSWSKDKYIRVIDGQARSRMYPARTVGTSTSTESTATQVGRLPQTTGESAIDNLVLPSIRTRKQSLRLMVGYHIQQFFLRVVQRRQNKLLILLGFHADSGTPLEDDVKARAVDMLVEEAAASPGICPGSVALDMLAETGRSTTSFGQFPEDIHRKVDNLVCDHLDSRIPDAKLSEELHDFLNHCEKHPGRSYARSGVQHKLMIFKAIASPDLRIRWRSEQERFTQHRYISLPWVRRVPLYALSPASQVQNAKDGGPEVAELARPSPQEAVDATDNLGASLVTLRAAGTPEVTRFRRNVFPYGDGHGLGQSGGGCAEMPAWSAGTLMYEWGTLLCEDERAKVPNHWVTDIEKIISDCLMVNPNGGVANRLPGELLHDVGQNPVAASSIGLTQHTQVTKCAAHEFPLFTERHQPEWHGRCGAWVDVVQVGDYEDAFFITFRTQTPDFVPLVEILVALRSKLMLQYENSIDFNVSCQASSDGEFIIIFTPVACIQKVPVPSGTGVLGLDFNFQNPDLGKFVTDERLPVALVDCSHGKGNFLAHNDDFWAMGLEGRPMLSRLYDFNRKPGVRAVATKILKDLLTSSTSCFQAL